MKRFIPVIFLFAVSSGTLFSQAWVKSFGSTQGNTEIAGVTTDSKSQAIITGSFSSGELKMDDSNTLKNNGISDVFLVKFDTSGNILWTLSFGGEKEEYVEGICLDNDDNIYITGSFRSSSFKIGTKTVSSAWPDNIYVAKFSPAGDLAWLSHSTGLTTYAWGTAVRYTGDNRILFSGSTSGSTVNFGNFKLSINSGYYKGYYGVLDKDGNFLAADLVGEEGENASQYRFNDITSDHEGNLYIAGSKTIRTEPDPYTWSDYRNVMYVTRIDADGNHDWQVEDTALHRAERIIRNNDSLFVLASREEYRNIFNGGTIDTTSAFYYGAYNLEGNKLWGKKHVGGLAYDACAKGGSIIITGGLLLDHLDLGEYQLHRNADSSSICPIYQDIFFLEIGKSGNLRNAESISGSLEDIPTSVWLSGSGDLYYSGIFESYKLQVEKEEIINYGELSVFQHVSGTYYNRSIYTFLARNPGFQPPSGINDPSGFAFRMYPNPARDWVKIEWQDIPGEVEMRLFDMHGRQVSENMEVSSPSLIDLSDLSPGMYIIALSTSDKTARKQLLIPGN